MRPALAHIRSVRGVSFVLMSTNPAYLPPPIPPGRPIGIKPRVVGPSQWKGQYITVNGYSNRTASILASPIDEFDPHIGPRTYDQMENDPTVIKIKNILITGATSDDIQLAPGSDVIEEDTTEASQTEDVKRYAQVQAFCQDMLDGLERPYKGYLIQMMRNAIPYGHAIAEVEWEYRRANLKAKGGSSSISPAPASTMARLKEYVRTALFGRGLRTTLTASLRSGRNKAALAGPTVTTPATDGARKQPSVFLMPISIKVKPRGAAYFVVDEYMTLLGLVPANRYRAGLQADEVVSRDKFLILTLNERDGDPRGRSEYRPIVTYWDFKQRIPKEYLLFLLQEAVPSAVGTLPEDADPYEFERGPNDEIVYEDGIVDAQGQPIAKQLTAAESMARQIKDFRSGSGAVIPYGAQLVPFRSGEVKGDVFANAINTADRQMENGTLLQPLAQSEGQHQARSAAQEHANILFLKHFSNRWGLAMMTLYDLLAVGVQMNLGDWALAYMPKISLGDSAPRDWAAEFAVLSDGYFKGFVDDTQRPPLMAEYGMPKPGKSRNQVMMEQGVGPQQPTQDRRTGTPNPAPGNRPDKQPGGRPANESPLMATASGLNAGQWSRKQYATYRTAR